MYRILTLKKKKITWLCTASPLLVGKKVKLQFGFTTIQNIFNIRGTNIYDVFIAHGHDI